MAPGRVGVSAEEVCRRIYRETKSFYTKLAEGREDVGFQILYGPPHLEAPILFLGYQPGKGCKTALEEREYGSEDGWPEVCEYATECWPLAKRLREIFGQELLKRSVGLNAIFVRSDNIAAYRAVFDVQDRKKIRSFCIQRVQEIITAVRPRKIVAIGFATLTLFGEGVRDLKGTNGRILTRTGKIAGFDAVAVVHLTGARISEADRQRIKGHLQAARISN